MKARKASYHTFAAEAGIQQLFADCCAGILSEIPEVSGQYRSITGSLSVRSQLCIVSGTVLSPVSFRWLDRDLVELTDFEAAQARVPERRGARE